MLVTKMVFSCHQHNVVADITTCGLGIWLFYIEKVDGVQNGPKMIVTNMGYLKPYAAYGMHIMSRDLSLSQPFWVILVN